jgi:AraC-like DNA-binding protein
MVISRQTVDSARALLRDISLPSSYLSLFLEQLLPEAGARERVLTAAGVRTDQLDQRNLPLDAVIAVIRALDQTLAPGWHVQPCLRLEPAQHGPVGLAAISAATVGNALNTIARFERLRAPWTRARLYREAGHQVLEIEQSQTLPEGGDLLMEMNLLALAGLIASLLGRFRGELRLQCPGPEQPWHRDLRGALGCPLQIGCGRSALVLPGERLSQRCLLADPELHDLMVHRCQRLLHDPAEGRFADRVLACLAEHGGRNPGLTQVARRLGVSERSLSRHLAVEGSSYRQLVDRTRYRLARELLCHSTVPIADIANRLGYGDPANFNRAFRRWSGRSPGEARRAGRPDRL